jgi:hypothetical protein
MSDAFKGDAWRRPGEHANMTLPQENPYLRFQQAASTGKTEVWLVVSRYGDPLGIIKWFGRWRQYAFFPEDGTIFNTGCMRTIVENIQWLMDERKKR